jgi:hypothetical protein
MKVLHIAPLLAALLSGCAAHVSLCGSGPIVPLNSDVRAVEAPPAPQRPQAKDTRAASPPQRSDPAPSGTRRVKLYFAQSAKPGEENCPLIVPVERDVAIGASLVTSVTVELLRGPTPEERGGGLLNAIDPSSTLKEAVVTKSLIDVRFVSLKLDRGVGCAAATLRKQVIATMLGLDLPGVDRVGISPDQKEWK